ncbi:MAG TPA: hypothetical protein VIJ25_10940, partial [Methylococcales bacterium]
IGSYSPKCLKGAENYIKDLNGGNTSEAEKLLKYALLADRLDLFGNECQIFGSLITPQDRAKFLQRPLTRQETPRYFAITTNYAPVRPDAGDPTINTAEENKNSLASDLSYKLPKYERTSFYNTQGGDESIWGNAVKSAEKNAALTSAADKTSAPVTGAPLKSRIRIASNGQNTSANGNTASSGGGFSSTANLNTCANKTTKACKAPSLSSCITVNANTSFKTVGNPEFGDTIPSYYTSLWQKASISGKSYYIPLDDVALDSDINSCGAFRATSYIVSGNVSSVLPKQSIAPTSTKNQTPAVNISKYTPAPQPSVQPTQNKPWYESAWGWITSSKRTEGLKQVGFGVLETVGGLASGATGVALLTAGGVTEVGTAGASTLISVPLVIGGGIALGYSANGITGGATGIVSGFKNIFGSSDEISNDRFSPGETLINTTTKEGSWQRTAAYTIYITGDVATTGGESTVKFAKELS